MKQTKTYTKEEINILLNNLGYSHSIIGDCTSIISMRIFLTKNTPEVNLYELQNIGVSFVCFNKEYLLCYVKNKKDLG